VIAAYSRPDRLSDALAQAAAGARVLAGGTDLYPATARQSLAGPLVDVTGIAELAGIAALPSGGLRIGACTTWAAIAAAPLPPALHALQAAARTVGGRQIQTCGTLGGNLCNASPAADGVPPLLAVAAEVELAGPAGRRLLPLAEFLRGPRRTALGPGEVMVAVHVPPGGLAGRSAFLKLGARAYLVISIAMAAVRLAVAGGRVREAALAVGAASPVARRLPAVEAALAGAPAAQAAQRIDPAAVAAALDPIDDVRAAAAYRVEAAATLLRRAVADLAGAA
jgi:CO/xanthine dehydrogenase FAD-binding subunit